MEQPGGLILTENHCPYCNQNLIMNKRQFANHIKYCDENPKVKENLRLYGKKISPVTINKLSKSGYNYHIGRIGKIVQYNVVCETCGKSFQVSEHEGKHPEKEHYYCSRSCANTRIHSDKTKDKISKSLQKPLFKICPICGIEFQANKNQQRFCSRSCGYKNRIIHNNLNDRIDYEMKCRFKFALQDFPDAFDFDLIAKYGWYSAPNHGNNSQGVERDHMFSISEGFKQQIDPYYISHPANCKLLLHSDNNSKNTKCSISKEELMQRIEDWNKKYGVYPNKT